MTANKLITNLSDLSLQSSKNENDADSLYAFSLKRLVRPPGWQAMREAGGHGNIQSSLTSGDGSRSPDCVPAKAIFHQLESSLCFRLALQFTSSPE
jgi:hypothetical protein